MTVPSSLRKPLLVWSKDHRVIGISLRREAGAKWLWAITYGGDAKPFSSEASEAAAARGPSRAAEDDG